MIKTIGIIWAIIGVANIVLSPVELGFTIIVNMLLFIIPGMLLAK